MAILKHFKQPQADSYVLPMARDLIVEPPPPPPPEPEKEPDALTADGGGEDGAEAEQAPPTKEEDPLAFARAEADAILRDAEREAEEYRQQAMAALEKELDEERAVAHGEGFSKGYAEGMAEAMDKASKERMRLASQQVEQIQKFLEDAARERDRIFDNCREEMKDLALAVAEKVIRVSLQNSDDILLRMVDAATDTHKRCEWARIYIADCDVKGKAYTVPELAASLNHISDRVRVIPMADDESGTCIVELPDVIMDASVSTQLQNIRETLDNTGLDME